MPKTHGPARRRILDAAARRFYNDGVTATGIDTITATAGVAKMSLYNNFASKADLVAAYLTERHDEWLGLYARRCVGADSAQARILAVFDAYLDHAEMAYEKGFRGCGLLNAAAELPAGSPGREAVREHKAEVEQILRTELTRIRPYAEAAALAEHLSFLLEGAMARAGLDGSAERLTRARAIAVGLIS
ncbi:TetR/AcrR family transcriptional regulator [Mycolicibacterium brumae]|uniref:TetR/AcrR family transcriptional regulator n=1 Tax=Mycolicibacterium brumae TaxID=85968 RepID=UPI000B327FFE|nr:TetR/AcrR family transcriptional regulator [Mycolicibacterium brumae]RWA23277.1 hypothetical protein MBRU_00225 [Mycolicibacterium brumae DSM 44177]UWW08795.1 TetR/AcrR family transcriptional regulator [Mycolicibacterium brumae]